MMEVFSSSILGRGADSLFRRDEKKPHLAVVPAVGIPGPGPALHAVVASEKPDGALILTVTPFTDDDAAPSSNATLQTLLVSCASSA
jgi:hypothetical protein